MNVYLYEGPDRYSALTPVNEGNQKLEASEEIVYSIPLESTLMVIAYPDKTIDETEFQISYWANITSYVPTTVEKIQLLISYASDHDIALPVFCVYSSLLTFFVGLHIYSRHFGLCTQCCGFSIKKL